MGIIDITISHPDCLFLYFFWREEMWGKLITDNAQSYDCRGNSLMSNEDKGREILLIDIVEYPNLNYLESRHSIGLCSLQAVSDPVDLYRYISDPAKPALVELRASVILLYI